MDLGGRTQKVGVGWGSSKFSVLRRREARAKKEAEDDMTNQLICALMEEQKHEIQRLKEENAVLKESLHRALRKKR